MKYVSRRADGSIALIMDELLPGYSLVPQGEDLLAEAKADNDPELVAEEWNRANPVPAEVTPYQLRVALRAAGRLADVEAWVAQQSPEAQDAWEYGLKRPIGHPLIVACAAACGLDLQAIFRAAGQVK